MMAISIGLGYKNTLTSAFQSISVFLVVVLFDRSLKMADRECCRFVCSCLRQWNFSDLSLWYDNQSWSFYVWRYSASCGVIIVADCFVLAFRLLLSSEISSQACPAQNIILLPPTPLVIPSSPDDFVPPSLPKGPTSAEKRTPAHPKTTKHRRRTLCFTPNPKRNQAALTPSLRGKLESLEASLEALAEAQRETEDSTISLINDSLYSTKNELRTFVRGKVEFLNNTIHKLNEKIVSLEKATAVLSKNKTKQQQQQNHSLKTQLGTCHLR